MTTEPTTNESWEESLINESSTFLFYDKQSGSRFLDVKSVQAFIKNVVVPQVTSSLRYQIAEELEGLKVSDLQVGKAPSDDAVGSEHRAFGRNKALSDAIEVVLKKEV